MIRTDAADLMGRIERRTARIGVVGLGYVGLPLALTFGERGFPVVGFDVDRSKIDRLAADESYLRHIPATRIREVRADERFEATTEFDRLTSCDAILLCVPTPLNAAREPDLSYVVNTAEAVAKRLRPGQLVVLESTTYPGTTDEVVRPILERGGLKAGRDFFLAFSPEREDPGNPRFDTRSIPKVVGGHTPQCLAHATKLYESAIVRVVPVSSTRVAELSKLFENIFRCVNIALVNELKQLCHRMDIDVHEVIDASATKPFGFMAFHPGPGLGGHCIPIDPFYLSWKAREYDFSTRFIELAGEINGNMPYYVVQRTMEALNGQGKAMKGARILVLGLAYKKNVDDVRESPSFRVIELLQKQGAQVSYHDPWVARTHRMRHHDLQMESVPLTEETLSDVDCALILTDHDDVDYERLARLVPLVVDTRNVARKWTQEQERIVPA